MKFGMNPSPYYRAKRSTTQIMLELMVGLAVIWVCAIVFYFIHDNATAADILAQVNNTNATLSGSNGVRAIINPIIAMLVAVVVEGLFLLPKHIKEKGNFVSLLKKLLNSYGYVTGMILALLLPVGTSIYAIIISTIFAVAVGKMLFGGFGYNIFNPAILGRIFAQTVFMSQMTYDARTIMVPESASLTINTGATVTTMLGQNGWSLEMLEIKGFSLDQLLLGNYLGTLGETFTIVLLVVGVVLAIRRVIDWRAPAFYLGTMFLASLGMGLMGGYGLASFEFALVQISIGGVMFGAIFCITDPVTSPTSQAGRVFFGIGAALITLVIRYLGSMPEGVAYSILLMNAFTPLIDSTIKGLTSQFKRRRIITAAVMGAVAIAAGFAVGGSQVEKGEYLNYLAEQRQYETGDLKTTINKVSSSFGKTTYHVTLKGILNDNTVKEIGDVNELFASELAQYQSYFTDTTKYSNAKYILEYSSNKFIMNIQYKDLSDGTTKTVFAAKAGLDVTPTIDETTNTWKVLGHDTGISSIEFNKVYNTADGMTLEGNKLSIKFADEYDNALFRNTNYMALEYNITLNYSKKVILSTELLSFGGSDGYGDALISENGGNSSSYSPYISQSKKQLAIEFYNKYIKLDNPVSFDEFTKYIDYDSNSLIKNPEGEGETVVGCGATYTAVAYIALMQRVIEYATIDHTAGKVAL